MPGDPLSRSTDDSVILRAWEILQRRRLLASVVFLTLVASAISFATYLPDLYQASAVVLKSGASADAKFDHGVAVFTMAKGGAMLEASIGGQSFTFKPRETSEGMNK